MRINNIIIKFDIEKDEDLDKLEHFLRDSHIEIGSRLDLRSTENMLAVHVYGSVENWLNDSQKEEINKFMSGLINILQTFGKMDGFVEKLQIK